MPYTVNGFGTSYWGKENLHIHRDSCTECGAMTDLSDYDTTQYFVAIFLPLIPLSKLRIFNDCGSCRKHQVMKLKEWKSLKAKEMEVAQIHFEQSPNDPDAAIGLLGKALLYSSEKGFFEHSKVVLQRHGSNPEVLATLGSCLEELGKPVEAEKVLRRSLKLKDAPETRQRLLWVLIQGGRTEEAKALLEGQNTSEDSTFLPSLYLLVEGLQAQGDHEGALHELATIEEHWPEEGKDPGFDDYRNLSLKHRAKRRPVVSATLKPLPVASTGRDPGGTFARFLWPVLTALILIPLIGVVFRAATSHEVYFLNGLQKPYSVQIGGETLALPRTGPVRHRLPLGKPLLLSPAGDAPDFEEQTITLDVSLGKSLFGDLTLVINPDRTAVLLRETTEYLSEDIAAIAKSSGDLPFALRAGLPFYEFEDIDYVFRDFPEGISMSGETKRKRKQALKLVEFPTFGVWSLLHEQDRQGEALAWIEARTRADSGNDQEDPYLLAQRVDPDEFQRIASRPLAARPLRTPWHRTYQNLLDVAGLQKRAESEYRSLLEEEPEDDERMYLLARVLLPGPEPRELIQRSIQGPEPGAWPLFGAAFQHFTEGRFEPALTHLRQAIEQNPGEPYFLQTESNIQIALGRYNELVEQSLLQRQGELDLAAMTSEITWLAAADRPEDCEELRDAAEEGMKDKGFDDEDIQQWLERLGAFQSLGEGDLKAFVTGLRAVEHPLAPLYGALQARHPEDLVEALDALPEATPMQLLLAHLVLAKASSPHADATLARAIEDLEANGSDLNILARELASSRPPADFQSLSQLPISIDIKAPALAILSRRGGKAAADLRRLARRLNSGPEFEAQILGELLNPGRRRR